ncbi:MAG: iron ABC transporter permease [Alphaproteobacteria bacterium]|jgi:iron complex transport system permease protein
MTIRTLPLWLCIFAGVALIVLSLCLGPYKINWSQLAYDIAKDNQTIETIVFFELRIPRTIMCILTGVALGTGGAALQTLLRNPLAEPSIIGISSSAALGAVLVMSFQLHLVSLFFMPVGAIIFSMVAASLLVFISRRSHDHVTILLVGVGISLLSGAATSFLLSISDNPYAVNEIVFWMLGSLSNVSNDDLLLAVPFALSGALLMLSTAPAQNYFVFGGEVAASSGINVKTLRAKVILGASLGVGGVTAIIGMVGFIGLLSPHIVRPFVGNEPRRTLIWSPVVAAALVLAADIAIRLLPTTNELRLGVVTTLIGAPLFLYVIFKRFGH